MCSCVRCVSTGVDLVCRSVNKYQRYRPFLQADDELVRAKHALKKAERRQQFHKIEQERFKKELEDLQRKIQATKVRVVLVSKFGDSLSRLTYLRIKRLFV